MGWTGLNGNVTIQEYAKAVMRTGLEIVASNVYGNQMYMAVRREDGMVFGAVILRKYDRSMDETFFKDMDEDCAPYYYHANKKVIDALTETTNENALSWRNACTKKQGAKKSRPKIIESTRVEYGRNVYLVVEVLGRSGYRVYSETNGLTYRMSCKQMGQSKVL